MPKALSLACLVLWICLGGSAWAKPKIAILGLEAAPGPSGAVDPETTQVARDITKELRQRAQSGASPYTVAPNSSKELTDEKLLMSCDNEAMSCMTVIGAGLAADVLLYGRVERKGDVYRVSLKLLDVKAKTIEPGGDEMPVGGSVTGVSKRLYNKLIGDGPSLGGTLIIKARSQAGSTINSGRVMIDEERKGDLSSGKLTVTGIPEGRHTIAIEAGGYQRFQETVTVHGGEQANLNVLLLDKESAPPPSSSSSTLPWKLSLGAGIAIAATGALYAYHSDNRVKAHLDLIDIEGMKGAGVSSDECGKAEATIIADSMGKVTSFNNETFQRACTWKTRTYLSFVVGGVGVLGAVASLIMLTRDTPSSEKQPTGARSKKLDVAIIPTFTPDGGGASLSVTW
jgi:PEGA domain